MTLPRLQDDALSLRELIAQLIDAGKAYARAEVAYLKQLVSARATAAAVGVALAIVALILVGSAVTVLLAALGLSLARWVGPAGGLAIAGVIGLVLAALLAWIGARRIVASGNVA